MTRKQKLMMCATLYADRNSVDCTEQEKLKQAVLHGYNLALRHIRKLMKENERYADVSQVHVMKEFLK